MRLSAPAWQFYIAYALLALPGVYIAFAGGPYPVPTDLAVKFYICIGFAIGAAIFIVRRRPWNLAGWAGVIFWGGLCAVGVVSALRR